MKRIILKSVLSTVAIISFLIFGACDKVSLNDDFTRLEDVSSNTNLDSTPIYSTDDITKEPIEITIDDTQKEPDPLPNPIDPPNPVVQVSTTTSTSAKLPIEEEIIETFPIEKDVNVNEITSEEETLETTNIIEEITFEDFKYEILGETITDVYMRLSPSKDGTIIRTISKGKEIFIANSSINGFTPIIYGSDFGYVWSDYLKFSTFEIIAKEDSFLEISNEKVNVSKGESFKLYKNSQGEYLNDNFKIVTLNSNFVTKSEYLMLFKDSAEKELVASFSTLYSHSEYYATKAYNINLCCEEVSVIIPNGEDFNWHKIVGNTGKAEGYKQANVFSGGQVVKGYGGGVCQVSTTIYGCVRQLNLPVIERHPHGMPVQYVDWYKGEDASVDDIGGFNFIWNNNTGYDILINAYTSTIPDNDIDHQGMLTIEFYKLIY